VSFSRGPLALHAIRMGVHDDVALASLLRPHKDGRGAAVWARELPGPRLARCPLGALQQAIEVFTGLAQASPQIRELTGQPLQEGTPLPPVLQELPNPPQQRPTVGGRR
jgi:hypothetical protein